MLRWTGARRPPDERDQMDAGAVEGRVRRKRNQPIGRAQQGLRGDRCAVKESAYLTGLTAASIRKAIHRRELTPIKIGERHYLTQTILREWIAACRLAPKDHASTSGAARVAVPSGSSSLTAGSLVGRLNY